MGPLWTCDPIPISISQTHFGFSAALKSTLLHQCVLRAARAHQTHACCQAYLVPQTISTGRNGPEPNGKMHMHIIAARDLDLLKCSFLSKATAGIKGLCSPGLLLSSCRLYGPAGVHTTRMCRSMTSPHRSNRIRMSTSVR